jgi:hypothetical protein
MLLWGHPLMKLFVLIVWPSVSFLFEITIIAIKKNQTGTKSTEVHIISGATGQFILNVGTILHETGDNFEFEVADWNRDGYQDIIAIAKNQTGTKSTEVHK